jgi:hypothetical protein
MSPYHFKPAKREGIRLLIGLIGGTGSGKTYTALELAAGLSGGKPFGVIDTENDRALHYADLFDFEHCDLQPPFGPDRYAGAIEEADTRGYGALVIDSASHSHMGKGGLLEWHDEAWGKLGRKESTKMLAWAKPKQANRNMIQAMLRAQSHVIVCMRAEHKVQVSKDAEGKMVVGEAKWQPLCEKHLPFEMTTSLLFDPAAPGVPIPLKLQEQHRHLFPLDKVITRSAGAEMAAWALGSASEDGALRKVIEDLRAAASIAELETLGKQIADIGLSQYDRGMAASAYKLRQSQLRKASK